MFLSLTSGVGGTTLFPTPGSDWGVKVKKNQDLPERTRISINISIKASRIYKAFCTNPTIFITRLLCFSADDLHYDPEMLIFKRTLDLTHLSLLCA